MRSPSSPLPEDDNSSSLMHEVRAIIVSTISIFVVLFFMVTSCFGNNYKSLMIYRDTQIRLSLSYIQQKKVR